MPTRVASLGPEATVGTVDCYSGGNDGVIWAILSDGVHGIQVCLDGRRITSTRDHLYCNARHPNKTTAVHIEPGSLEEAKVTSIFQRWLERESQADEGWKRGLIEAALSRITRRLESDSEKVATCPR
jgi:hypothetical protein